MATPEMAVLMIMLLSGLRPYGSVCVAVNDSRAKLFPSALLPAGWRTNENWPAGDESGCCCAAW